MTTHKCFKTSSSSKVLHILSPSSSSPLVPWSRGDEGHDALPLTSKALFSLSFCFCLTMVPLFFFFLFFSSMRASLDHGFPWVGQILSSLFAEHFHSGFCLLKKKSHFCSKHKCIFFKSEKMTVDLREKGSGRCVCLLNGWRDSSRSWRHD